MAGNHSPSYVCSRIVVIVPISEAQFWAVTKDVRNRHRRLREVKSPRQAELFPEYPLEVAVEVACRYNLAHQLRDGLQKPFRFGTRGHQNISVVPKCRESPLNINFEFGFFLDSIRSLNPDDVFLSTLPEWSPFRGFCVPQCCVGRWHGGNSVYIDLTCP
jgi:hypothetical protein